MRTSSYLAPLSEGPWSSVTVSCPSLLIVVVALLIGTATVSNYRYRDDGENHYQYKDDNFHDSLSVIVVFCVSSIGLIKLSCGSNIFSK